MKPKVTKAVIAAAGFGTRFLPQTKAMPKEMLPLVDKPIIQYVVEQLVEAGISDIIIVSGYSKRSIEDHFDTPNQDLLVNLRQGGVPKRPYIKQIEKIANLANFAYVRQKGPYGTATPLSNAAHLIGDEPFIYTFADDLIVAHPNRFKQMMRLYGQLQGSILSCLRIENDQDFAKYGILAGDQIRPDVLKMNRLVEKPGRAKAPSNFASIGGYLLTPEVFDYIERGRQLIKPGKEFFLTDCVLQPMIADGKALYGCELKNSKYYDTGNKLEYLKTVVDFALQHDDIAADFKAYLASLGF
ncbi:MAG: UTP--glucose-1-phosphate uridylyltransferase [Candidatus Saccharimonadales bacterium]